MTSLFLMQANSSGVPSLLSAAIGALSMLLLAVVAELLRRGTAARERAAKLKEKNDEGEVVNSAARMNSLKDLQIHYDEQIHRLRKEFNTLRVQDLIRIGKLEDSLEVLRGCYFGLYAAAQMLQFTWRGMRNRLRKVDEDFQDTDYPDVDLAPWSPEKVFPRLTAHTVTVTVSPETGAGKPTHTPDPA